MFYFIYILLVFFFFCFFFFKQKTAYEMRISDWSSDVCSSDLLFAAFMIVTGHLERRDQAFDAVEVAPGFGREIEVLVTPAELLAGDGLADLVELRLRNPHRLDPVHRGSHAAVVVDRADAGRVRPEVTLAGAVDRFQDVRDERNVLAGAEVRSEERRVGKGGVRTVR